MLLNCDMSKCCYFTAVARAVMFSGCPSVHPCHSRECDTLRTV